MSERLWHLLSGKLDEIAALYKVRPRITLIVRVPGKPKECAFLSDDAWADAVATVGQLHGDPTAFAAGPPAPVAESPAPAAPDELRDALARFGAALLPKWWDDGNAGDIDGADAQDAAEACGLWHRVERHADGVECEWCGNEEPCGELTEAGLAALAARGGE